MDKEEIVVAKHSLAKVVIKGIFIISVIVLLVATVQLYRSHAQINRSLQEWENIKATSGAETPPVEDQLQVETLIVQENKVLDQAVQESNAEFHVDGEKEKQVDGQQEDYPIKGEIIGKLIIPALNRELPIIHGTESKQLAQGVGHYIGSALPGESNHTVLAGHRETVFLGLGQLELGEQIHIETKRGLFTYQLESQQIVDADDRTIIVSTSEPILTLITCYPFDYVGAAPQRYILSGKLIED